MSSHEWKIKIKSGAKGDLRKVTHSPLRNMFNDIKQTLEQNPYDPKQSFEKLTLPAAGYYSRRLNGQHRVVYKILVESRTVIIYSCWAHYENGGLDMSGKPRTAKTKNIPPSG
ncbi:Txe/YoeB family addiction module toxin [Lentilactobacillus buchneri subsp. silagei]|uniref:Txe/YoeB family addiction module toxin n=1 Tax=Lentilactobacillus buchneri TaxID=1581 RepID=UPI0012E4B762|nr:Txe/YoeB family addiction module toxin [Lentilactobacillus buchneri]GED93424.1 Txe/YoeB family addiction module toxin [Lentilactobacillus buchneri subsp. silagei]